MKINFLLLGILALGTAGCDLQQNKLLTLREEFNQELKAKDKTVEDLNRKINDLDQRNGALEQRLIKESGGSPDKLAAAITDSVSRSVAEQNALKFAEIKAELGEVLKAVKSGGAIAPASAASSENVPVTRTATPPAQAPVLRQSDSGSSQRAEPRDPNTKKFKMSW